MLISTPALGEAIWELPPLILHPFSERTSPESLLENSKAALMLSGLLPGDGQDREALNRKLLAGRYSEIRMLYFLGKDAFRWIGQCMEIAARIPELGEAEVKRQSFAGLLGCPPPNVREKLLRWGVNDYPSVFARAVGLNALFAEPPAFETLAADFIRNYHRAADLLYQAFMESEPHRVAAPRNFRFDLYASGEYAKMLATEWAGE
ncbi:MAG: hypothetical protein WBY44_24890, partial [Bryobacteraceae bacterium]|jgi:hypothetical protein